MDLTHLDSVRAMNQRGMSQRVIADSLGISQASVGRLLRYKDGKVSRKSRACKTKCAPMTSEWSAQNCRPMTCPQPLIGQALQ